MYVMVDAFYGAKSIWMTLSLPPRIEINTTGVDAANGQGLGNNLSLCQAGTPDHSIGNNNDLMKEKEPSSESFLSNT